MSRRFLCRQHASQALRELLHRVIWIIGAHVWHVRERVAGTFFQHVCGNSAPVSAL
jgi:hypothetical protein